MLCSVVHIIHSPDYLSVKSHSLVTHTQQLYHAYACSLESAPMFANDGQRRFFGAAGEGGPRGSYLSGASTPNLDGGVYSGDEDSARGIRVHAGIPAGSSAQAPYRDNPSQTNFGVAGAEGAEGAEGENYRNSGDAFDKEAAAAATAASAGNAGKRDRMLNNYTKGGSASRRRKLFWIAGAVLLLVIIAAIAIPVAITKSHKSSSNAATKPPGSPSPSSGPGSGPGSDPPSGGPTTGGDGSTITTADGTKFTYNNKFGGLWVDDPSDPFNNNAQAQSWTPPLNQSWDWSKDRIFG